MASVEVSFTPLPAHVRTARLVALAVARRAGVDEALLDEIRLAVGEACSRAVHINGGTSAAVVMRLSDDQDKFTVEVVDCGAMDPSTPETGLDDLEADALESTAEGPGSDLLPPGFGLAVISGLVEDMSVDAGTDGTHVRMTWPANDAMAPDPS